MRSAQPVWPEKKCHEDTRCNRHKCPGVVIIDEEKGCGNGKAGGRSFRGEVLCLVTGNLRHFPQKPIVITPAEMMKILEENEKQQ